MPSLPPLPAQFSADIVRSDGDAVRIFVDGEFERHEDLTGNERTLILRPDKRTMYTLDDGARNYLTVRLSAQAWAAEFDADSFCDWTLAGTRKIDGRACLRYVGRYRRPSGKAYEECFVDAETQMRRREVTYNKAGRKALTVDYLNVVLGPPDPDVFEIPKGYKKVKL